MDFYTKDLLNPETPFTQVKLNTLEMHINNMYSNDLQIINFTQLILSQLKEQTTIFINIRMIMENAKLNRTKLYILIMFEQKLKYTWEQLNLESRRYIKNYFLQVFLNGSKRKFTDQQAKSVYKIVLSILVKLFILSYLEWNTFVQDLLQQAKKDQILCQNVLSVYRILGQQIQIIKKQEQNAALTFLKFIQQKYPHILTLCLMILEANKTNQLKLYLIKLTYDVTQKYLSLISKPEIIPEETIESLIDQFNKNIFRVEISKIFITLCKINPSLVLFQKILNSVQGFIGFATQLDKQRRNIAKNNERQLNSFDFLMKNLAIVMNVIVSSLIKTQNYNQFIFLSGYRYILLFSVLNDKDTWQICLQAWVLYFQNKLHEKLNLNLQILARSIVKKCVCPIQLRSNINNTQQQQQSSQLYNQINYVINQLCKTYLQIIFETLWNIIQKQIHIKFNEEEFQAACYTFCYMVFYIGEKEKQTVLNLLKLLMNISQSVQSQYKKIVVQQILNIVSYYSFIMKNNPFLAEVIQEKFINNIPNSLNAFINLAKNFPLNANIINILQNKTKKMQIQITNPQGDIQKIWEVILMAQKNLYDIREQQITISKEDVLNYFIRNYAGLKTFQLNWNIKWDIIQKIFFNNLQIITNLIKEKTIYLSQNKTYKRIHAWIIKVCTMYCALCKKNNLNRGNQFQFLARAVLENSSIDQITELSKYF